jgi:hypothetical protein
MKPLTDPKETRSWTRRTAVACLLGLCAAAARAQGKPPDLDGMLRRIQATCFALYSPEKLRQMSGGDGHAPETIRDDPRGQVKYLKAEEKVDRGLFYPSILEDLLPAFDATVRPEARGRLRDRIAPARAVLRRGDFFAEDFSAYDILFYYGSGCSMETRLLDKLRREMNDSAVLILVYPATPPEGFRRVADCAGVGLYRPER